MLQKAHQGYIYQDILGAYFIANEIAQGNLETQFVFDKKQAKNDKFDDIIIKKHDKTQRMQIKYSDDDTGHVLTKDDIANSSTYDLALHDLYKSWKELNCFENDDEVRICLAWAKPIPEDKILDVFEEDNAISKTFEETTTYRINALKLWPDKNSYLKGWVSFKKNMESSERGDFIEFTRKLIIEVNFPKSSLLKDSFIGIEKFFYRSLDRIGIGEYPNNHISIKNTAIELAYSVMRSRAINNQTKFDTTAKAEAIKANIKLEFGAIEQNFYVDNEHLINTPNAVDKILANFENTSRIIVVGEPGSGKSWFVNNFQSKVEVDSSIVKHYCYTSMFDIKAEKKRITVNAVYGSLIYQLLKAFPKLINYKIKRYASNLEELNRLIANIPSKTFIIVDGLDHIWRIYHRNKEELTEHEISILVALQKIEIENSNVKLMVLSQPIRQLESLPDFKQIQLPKWSIKQVQELMNTYKLEDIELDENEKLSQFLLNRGEGNALYTNYLIHEITEKSLKTQAELNLLPQYNFNLSNYYSYLLGQIDESQSVPNAFCGASFSFSSLELKEVTGLGKRVDEHIAILKPILKNSIAYEGLRIYHESFKRFMIEKLVQEDVDIYRRVYEPLIIWLRGKDFFQFRKASLYMLPLLYKNDKYSEIISTINMDFVSESLFYGHPITIINQNHVIQAKSLKAIDINSLYKIVIVSEQSKVVFQLDQYLGKSYREYLIALNSIHNTNIMNAAIFNEGDLSVNRAVVCDLFKELAYNNENVNWDLVWPIKKIHVDDVSPYVTFLLQRKKYNELDNFIEDLFKSQDEFYNFIEITCDEISNWKIHFSDDWIAECTFLNKLIEDSKKRITTEIFNESVEKLKNEGNKLNNGQRKDYAQILLKAAKKLAEDGKSIDLLEKIKILGNINWFYNWLIYLVHIGIIEASSSVDFKEVEKAFKYLTMDIDRSKGSPRTCDLYGLESFVHLSFKKGLSFCKTINEKRLCLNYLKTVSEKTTSFLFESPHGPITPDVYLELSQNYLPVEDIISQYEMKINEFKEYRLYDDIAVVLFQLAKFYCDKSMSDKAKATFREAIRYLTAYGFRKDRTLSELIDCCYAFYNKNSEVQIDDLYQLYRMAMSVVIHTDGKGTNYYPIEWFKEHFKLFPKHALAFLATETLANSSYHFHQEKQLLYLLENKMFEVSPTIQYFLLRSFPTACDASFFSTSLDIVKSLPEKLITSATKWIETLLNRIGLDSSEKYPISLVEKFSDYLGKDVSSNFADENLEQYKDMKTETELEKDKKVSLSSFLPDNLNEALAYIEDNSVDRSKEEEIKSYIQKIEDFEEKKKFLKTFIKKKNFLSRTKNSWIIEILPENTDEWVMTNVAAFVFERDGWFHPLVNFDFFEAAYRTNPELCMRLLIEFLSEYLGDEKAVLKLSGNLISALSKIDIESSIVKSAWKTVFQMIKKRIPCSFEYDFSEKIDSDLINMNEDELYICIFLARLKTLTIERVQGICYGLSYIAKQEPELLVKPLNWILSQEEGLLPIQICTILQIIFESDNAHCFSKGLENTLKAIYPTNFFLTDFIIEKMLNHELSIIVSSSDTSLVLFPPHHHDQDFLKHLHYRYYYLEEQGFLFPGVLNEFRFLKEQREQTQLFEDYYNMGRKVIIQTIICSNLIFSIIQNKFYAKFRTYSCLDSIFIYQILRLWIDKTNLVYGSRTLRNNKLPLPHTINADFVIKNIDSDEEWVTIASIENEFYSEKHFDKYKHVVLAQTLVFDKNVNQNDYHYSTCRFLYDSYDPNNPNIFKKEKSPIVHEKVKDSMEEIDILFLSPYICKEIGISINDNFIDGLNGINRDSEIVLKYQCWKSNYLSGSDVNDEFPTKIGCELMIRKNYYQKMCSLYSNEPFLVREFIEIGKQQ